MGVIAEGIPRVCQGLFTPVSLGYPLSVFNKNSTLTGSSRKLGHMRFSSNMLPFKSSLLLEMHWQPIWASFSGKRPRDFPV